MIKCELCYYNGGELVPGFIKCQMFDHAMPLEHNNLCGPFLPNCNKIGVEWAVWASWDHATRTNYLKQNFGLEGMF